MPLVEPRTPLVEEVTENQCDVTITDHKAAQTCVQNPLDGKLDYMLIFLRKSSISIPRSSQFARMLAVSGYMR